MRFYTQQHKYYCGIDLHARMMYVCILDAEGKVLVHKNISAAPEPFLAIIAPYREDLCVAVECIFTWYWLADLCAREDITFVLGHALYMKAVHGGKKKNDRVDSHKIAVLLRGGNIPVAYVYPAEMRATRDLLRRRCYFSRKRGELFAHIQNTASQYNLPPLPRTITTQSGRGGVPEHFPDPQVRKSIEVDLSLIERYDDLLRDVELHIVRTARVHDAANFIRLRSIPGIGKILSLVILYEIQDIGRFPSVQDFLSYARLVKCAKESNGKLYGYGGKKMGSVYLKWAFSEAATLFLRNNLRGKAFFAKLEQKYGKAKALSVLAHKLGRVVYFMMSREQNFDVKKFVGLVAAGTPSGPTTPGDAAPPARRARNQSAAPGELNRTKKHGAAPCPA